MEPNILMKGFIIGFLLCAPVGPIGLLCARRALLRGRIEGVISLLGASMVDALYCSLAGLGIVWISDFLRQGKTLIQFFGALVLILVATKILVSGRRLERQERQDKGLFGSFSSMFLLSLANPMPILVFTTALAALGVPGSRGDYASAAPLSAGVFCGSAIWSPILVLVTGLFRLEFNSAQMEMINKVSAAIILATGLVLGLYTLINI